jgi:hypothetical protein
MNHWSTGAVNVSFPMEYLKEARKRSARLFAVVIRKLGTSTRVDEQATAWGDLDDDREEVVTAVLTWLLDHRVESLTRIRTVVDAQLARRLAVDGSCPAIDKPTHDTSC